MGCFSSKAVDDVSSLGTTSTQPGPNFVEAHIQLKNKSKREVLVFIVKDQGALRLKKKIIQMGGGAKVKAGIDAGPLGGASAGFKLSRDSASEYVAEGGGIDVQKVRIKSGSYSWVHMFGDDVAYIAVLFYKDEMYNFAIESRQVTKGGKFAIRDDHLTSEMPFKKSAEEPDYGSKMEQAG